MQITERYTVTVRLDQRTVANAADALLIPVLVKSTELDIAIDTEGRRTPRALSLSSDGDSLCSIVCAEENLARRIGARIEEIGRYRCSTDRWEEVTYSAADTLAEKERTAQAEAHVQERYWRESEFGWIGAASPRELHGAYKQLVPNRKGKYAQGTCRTFAESHPDQVQGLARFTAAALKRAGMPHHAAKIYQHYDLAQCLPPGEGEWEELRADRVTKHAAEEQRAQAAFSAAVKEFWGSEECLDSYIARTWPQPGTDKGDRHALKEYVVQYGENRWWEKTDAGAVLHQLFESRMLMPLDRFLEGCTQLFGRPIGSVEYAFSAELMRRQVLLEAERSIRETLEGRRGPNVQSSAGHEG